MPALLLPWILYLTLVAAVAAQLSPSPNSQDSLAALFHPPPALASDFGSYRSLLIFEDGTPVRTATDWPRRRAEIRQLWENEIGRWPPLLPKPALKILGTTNRGGFVQHSIRLETAPGQHLAGYLLQPPGPGPFPAVFVPYYDPETSVGLSSNKLRDFAVQLTQRGFVSLSIGSPGGDARRPDTAGADCQPLHFLGSVAANAHTALAALPQVDSRRIGIAGHSYGGKWAMFAACFDDRYACAAWSDPGIGFDDARPSINYWEPWYLGRDPSLSREPGLPTAANPATGAYLRLRAAGRDLHEVQALMAPRPFLVSGGEEDGPGRWRLLNRVNEVYALIGAINRVALSNRPGHDPTLESNEQIYRFFERFLQ